jgi:integrase/recombinase XerD
MTPPPNALASTLRKFFGDHLPTIRGLSPHTIRSYRDSVSLLLRFLATTTGRPVATLDVPDLTVEHIVDFLHHVEQHRGVTATTRNVQLAAIHAFARLLATLEPIYLAQDPAGPGWRL